MTRRDVVAIGGSLGAVEAVRTLCRALPADLGAAVAITLHVGAEGRNFLADIFDQDAAMPVRTAVEGEPFLRGRAYVAPADRHLLVIDGAIRLGCGPRENMARPAIDPMFRSLGAGYGPRVIGLVLTGMLDDGASGLADLKSCGGVTVVQGPRGAEAPDMPLAALRSADVDYRAPLPDLAALLARLVGEEAGPAPPVPEEIRLEVEIALGARPVTSDEIHRVAAPVPLSCPACGGVLSEVDRGPPLRFRCQVGHGFTGEALVTEKEGAVDEAMRVALRIIEERAVLAGKLAEDARRTGRFAAARASDERARESRRYEEVLRRAVLPTASPSPKAGGLASALPRAAEGAPSER